MSTTPPGSPLPSAYPSTPAQAMPPSLHVRQTRQTTTALVWPKPESAPDKYTLKRVKEGLDYAEQTLKSTTRKPSPNSFQAFSVYWKTCDDFLTEYGTSPREGAVDNSDKKRKKVTAVIREMEIRLNGMSWTKFSEDDERQHLKEQLINLRVRGYYARYGDCAKLECVELRQKSNTAIETLEPKNCPWAADVLDARQDWHTISENVEKEQSHWDQYGTTKGTGAVRTIYAVWSVCREVGMDFDRMVHAIHCYAARNQLVYNNVGDLVKAQEYDKIKIMLFADMTDIESVLPPQMTEEKVFMKAFLRAKIDRWYTVDDEAVPGSWGTKDQLKEDRKEMIRDEDAAKVRLADNDAHATSVALKALERHNAREELWKQAHIDFPGDSSTLPESGIILGKDDDRSLEKAEKRKASSSLSPRTRRRAFNDIMYRQLRIGLTVFTADSDGKDAKAANATAQMFKDRAIKSQNEVNRCVSAFKDRYG